MSNYPVNQMNHQPSNNGAAQHVVSGPTRGNNFHPPSVLPFQVNSQQLTNFNPLEQRNSQQFSNFNSIEPRNIHQFTNFNSVEPRNSQQFSNFNSVGQRNFQQFMNCNVVEQRNLDCFVRSIINSPAHFDMSVRSSQLPHYSLNQCNMQQGVNYNTQKFRASEISVSDNGIQSEVSKHFNSAYRTGNSSKWNSEPRSNYHLNNFNTDNNYTRNSSVGNNIHQNDSKFNSVEFNSNSITSKFSMNRVNENQPNWKFDKNKTFHNGGNVRKPFHNNGHHGKKNDFEVKQEAKQKHMCDTCDRAFNSETDYQSHVSSHIKCRFPNCEFEAHPAIVTLHKKMQHDTGYADRINKLKSDEEIEKWRSERIRHFPTAENILKRKAEEAEKEARGEVIEEKEFGKFKKQKQDQNGTINRHEDPHWKGKKRARKRNNKPRMSFNVPSVSTVSGTDSESDDDSHIKLHRFLGMFASSDVPVDIPVNDKSEEVSTDAVKNVNHNEMVQEALDSNKPYVQCKTEEKDVKIQNVFKSSEMDLENGAPIEIPINKERVILTSDLQNASEKAASFPDHINDKDAEIKSIAFTSIESDLDNEAPIEMPIRKERDVHISDSQSASENVSSFPNHKSDKDEKTCKKFSKQENKTLNKHKNAEHNSFRKETLLEKLLADQIRKERNVIMQCVRHIVKNDFFGIGKRC
ncbi:nuclear fragile X mental retardation-interacting protein 1 [Trichonephila clavata]|uniref:Nuclear fragile X mental retardation-interacting protein 1 n=1 Tax=Trichonephila clavata TaxID=2740835 RepID=A0A8X6HDC4_TRICU|nr:nuclear fragile X mental retardation-interacting protein 1 [Trichonephila clavata]